MREQIAKMRELYAALPDEPEWLTMEDIDRYAQRMEPPYEAVSYTHLAVYKRQVVGDLGLWNGRRMGYKEIHSGNMRDCLYSDTDYSTWYVDRLGDLRCDDIHHDGTNHYLYRVYKDSASPSQIELLKEKLYRGTATRADITRVTRRLGDDIAKVYGFSRCV